MHEEIPLAPVPRTPRLPGEVVVRPGVDEVVDALAADLLVQARLCIRSFGDFHLALSGGSTPEPLYKRLMYDPALRDFPWTRTHLWQVDERRVPEEDERRNYRLIRETIVEHSGLPAGQAHPMEAMADDAAERYERSLREALEWRERGHDRLDFVLLGMGADLHTASLFPGSGALTAPPGRLVVVNEGAGVTPPDRVTLTLEMINASRFVGVMVTGPGKREAVRRLESGHLEVREAPIWGVRPLAGVLRWYLDEAACPRE